MFPHCGTESSTKNGHELGQRLFKGGRVKPGTYKIYNICYQCYSDFLEQSEKLCCYPARDVEDRRGLGPCISQVPAVRMSDGWKGESKTLELGTRYNLGSVYRCEG